MIKKNNRNFCEFYLKISTVLNSENSQSNFFRDERSDLEKVWKSWAFADSRRKNINTIGEKKPIHY